MVRFQPFQPVIARNHENGRNLKHISDPVIMS